VPGAVRAVFDTNIFLRALINPHSRCGRLLSDTGDSYTLVLSPEIIREIMEVLQRPVILKSFPSIAAVSPQRMLELFARADVVHSTMTVRVSRDPADDMFVACALAGKCQYLVSEDKDLTSLEEVRGVRILSSEEFARAMGIEEQRRW